MVLRSSELIFSVVLLSLMYIHRKRAAIAALNNIVKELLRLEVLPEANAYDKRFWFIYLVSYLDFSYGIRD